MAACITVGTRENCCLKIASTLFQPASAGNDLKHFITATGAFPMFNSIGFHLVTAAIFSSFRIQSKYNSGFHQM